jgi:peptide/nickel transport system substrate-binding protein
MGSTRRSDRIRRLGLRAAAFVLAALLLPFGWTSLYAAPAGPRAGGELRVAQAIEPDNLDPHSTASRYAGIINRLLFDTLIVADSDGFKPGLATSWEVGDGGRTYTFRLRQGVRFHDGTAFNAEAVKLNLERVMDPQVISKAARSFLGPFDRAEVVDPFTVRVRFTAPYGPFMMLFASGIGMVSPAAARAAGPRDFGFKPVGSGPFRFREWSQGSHITVVRNPDYNWASPVYRRTGPPLLDAVTFRFIREPGTRGAVLEANEVDVVIEAPPESASELQRDRRYQLVSAPIAGPGIHYVINAGRGALRDVRVRRALLHATNRDVIMKTVNFDLIKGNSTPLAPGSTCYDASLTTMYPYDLNRARAMLEDSGWTLGPGGIRTKGGQRLSLRVFSLVDERMNILLQAQFKTIGVELVSTLMASDSIQIPMAQKGDFDLMWRRWTSIDPQILGILYKDGSPWFWNHVKNPRVDELLTRGEQVVDTAQRCAAYSQAQRIIMQEAWIIPIEATALLVAARANVRGLRLNPSGDWAPLLYEASLD